MEARDAGFLCLAMPAQNATDLLFNIMPVLYSGDSFMWVRPLLLDPPLIIVLPVWRDFIPNL